MSAPAWTAGPWRTHATGWVVAVCGNPPGCAVWADSDAPSVETIRANVSLIAAAPDLYEAAWKFANEAGGLLSAYEDEIRSAAGNTNYGCAKTRLDELRLALSKARGEPTPSEGGVS